MSEVGRPRRAIGSEYKPESRAVSAVDAVRAVDDADNGGREGLKDESRCRRVCGVGAQRSVRLSDKKVVREYRRGLELPIRPPFRPVSSSGNPICYRHRYIDDQALPATV